MLGNAPFYHSTIRKMVAMFGTMFNDIHFHRYAADGSVSQIIRVPLTYAPKNKLLLRADVDPDATKEAAIVLPRMAFEIIPPFRYAAERRMSHMTRYVVRDDDNSNKLMRQYIQVPYDMNFNLYVYVNNIEDGNKIIEQIIPFFTPDWTLSVNIIPEMGISLDIPVELKNVSFEDKYDGNFTDRRVFIWTLSFTVKTAFFGPIKSKPIIKFAHERFIISSTSDIDDSVANTDVLQEIVVSPGQDANGVATSNASLTVNANTIFANTDFGFIEEFTSGPISFE